MILAIVQARMSSQRLPGKVMKEILGRPLITYTLERLRAARQIDKIILATSDDKTNDPLCRCVEGLGYAVFRGSEDDVVDRFYQAAKKFQATHVVRITGDCPLLDPFIIDQVVDVFQKQNADLVLTGPKFAEGVDCEIFSAKALERAWREANRKSEREHVTQYFLNHPELFKSLKLENSTDDSRYRFVCDEPEDFKVVAAVLEAFAQESRQDFSVGRVKKFLDSHPGIFQLNAHVVRNAGLKKSLQEDGLFRHG